GNLPNKNVTRFALGTDADNPALIKIRESLVTHIGNVPGHLFRPQFGVARNTLEFFDMNRSINILFHDALTDKNRIFEVVPAPRHERHEHIAAERKLSHLRGGTISDNIPGLDLVAHYYDRPLVDAGVLIGALILDEIVDI